MTTSYCPNCGSEINLNDVFCNSCGASIESKSSPTPSQTYPPPPPQQHYPPPPTQQYGASNQTTYVQPGRPSTSQTDVLGIVSLITAVVGYIVAFIFTFVSPAFFLVGLITGIIGMKKSPTNKGLSIAGLILSIIGLVISIIVIILLIVVFSSYYFFM